VKSPIVLFCGRFLYHKGIAEFVEAARLLKADGISARFVLVGDVDQGNPSSVSRADVDAWVAQGAVENWGWCSDMPAVMREATLVVLPTYREGTPKVILEAAATGRPAIVTDVPGCRDAVIDGETGYLVPPRDVAALVAAIGDLLVNPRLMAEMGYAARLFAERGFSSEVVAQSILSIYSAGLASMNERRPSLFARMVGHLRRVANAAVPVSRP
jgi:glycosyltransferase involved in cell wall biosynthesis